MLFAALIAVVVGFQLALAAGAPWGHLTMGGAYPGQLPPNMRVAAVIQAVVLAMLALVVAARARLVLPRWHNLSRKLIWLVVVFMGISVVLHVITPSAAERALWLPVIVVLAICAVIVARER
jgi:hypothetical protein